MTAWRKKQSGINNGGARRHKNSNFDLFVCTLQGTKTHAPTSGGSQKKHKNNKIPKEELLPTNVAQAQTILRPAAVRPNLDHGKSCSRNGDKTAPPKSHRCELCYHPHTKTTCAALETKNPAKQRITKYAVANLKNCPHQQPLSKQQIKLAPCFKELQESLLQAIHNNCREKAILKGPTPSASALMTCFSDNLLAYPASWNRAVVLAEAIRTN